MKFEIRADGSATIEGYVNVVGRESRVLQDVSGQFIETIAPKTFQRSLERNADVGLMFNHQRALTPISMKLEEDAIGLRAFVEINDADIIAEAKDNKLTGWSFGFFINQDSWENRAADNMRMRTITDLDLIEVSILDITPAYIATSIEMRDSKESLKEVRSYSETMELVDNSVKVEDKNDDAVEMLMQEKRKFNFMIL